MREYIVRETGYPGTLKQEIVQELVRCKDCKHRYLRTERVCGHNYSSMSCGYEDDNGDPYVHTRDAQNDMYYCADAERKEHE